MRKWMRMGTKNQEKNSEEIEPNWNERENNKTEDNENENENKKSREEQWRKRT